MENKSRIKRGRYYAVRVGGKYIYEHRYIMQSHLGRLLDSSEAVHHINHDTRDNRIENLLVCRTHGEHTRIHHPEIAEKHKTLFKGKHFSPDTEFKKADNRLIGNKFRQGLPSWNKGKPWSKEMKKKLSVAHIGKHTPNEGSFFKRQVAWNKGKKWSEETRLRQKEAYRKRVEKNQD
jgi:hypothetical protein